MADTDAFPQMRQRLANLAHNPTMVVHSVTIPIVEVRDALAELERLTSRETWSRRTGATVADPIPMKAALRRIASQGCSRLIDRNCDSQGHWTEDAEHLADRVCDPCQARRALERAGYDLEASRG